jgi:hypothetical protein
MSMSLFLNRQVLNRVLLLMVLWYFHNYQQQLVVLVQLHLQDMLPLKNPEEEVYKSVD